jgi:putative effector of murein hydrolase
MNGKELFGIGRTWFTIILIVAAETVLTAMSLMAVEQWVELTKWLVVTGAGKSTAVAVADKFGGKK